MNRWVAHGIVAIAALVILGAWPAGAKADEFASQGQTCGSPGRPMDMSRIDAAVRQYKNGRLVFLTPAEEAGMRERLRQENEAGRSPLQEMAPCFGCTQDRSACIVYDGPDQRRAQAPDSYGSNGGSQPPPGGSDTDICRKSPQSYSCLFGHRDVVPPPVPQPGGTDCETARAPCSSKALAAEGWRIKRRITGNECQWTKAAAEETYDPPTINAAWKTSWYPKWKAAVQKVFDQRLPLMRGLTAKGVTVDWWFSVEINPDGSIRAVVDQKSLYQPKNGPGYGDSRFREDTEGWVKLLGKMRGPAFPAGSALTGATMSVNFNNRDGRVRDTPDIPEEPPLRNDQKVNAKQC